MPPHRAQVEWYLNIYERIALPITLWALFSRPFLSSEVLLRGISRKLIAISVASVGPNVTRNESSQLASYGAPRSHG